MKKIVFTVFFAASIIVLPLFDAPKVNADTNFEILDYSFSIVLDESGTGHFEHTLELHNLNSNLVGGYDLTLPYAGVTGVTADREGNEVALAQTEIDKTTKLELNFSNAAIMPNETGKITLRFTVPNLFKTKFNIKYFYLPKIIYSFEVPQVDYKLSYPEVLDIPTYIYGSEVRVNEDGRLEASSPGALLVVWGEHPNYGFTTEYKIRNSNTVKSDTLVNLASHTKQDVYYVNVPKLELGLVDDLGNNWGVLKLDAGEEMKINIEGYSTYQDSLSEDDDFANYGWTINEDDNFGKELAELVRTENDRYTMLREVNTFLLTSLEPYANEKTNLDELNNIWTRAGTSSKFNAFEYCYFVIAAAEASGLQGRIAYGYLTIDDIFYDETLRLPHVWCEIKVGEDVMLLDPFLEDVTKLSFFNRKPIDRIRFGAWHNSQSYNTLLGILVNAKDTQLLRIGEARTNETGLGSFDVSINFPANVISGDFYSGDVIISNTTNKFTELTAFKLNNEDIASVVNYGSLKIALAPLNSNYFKISNLNEGNIFYQGRKKMELLLEFGDEKNSRINKDFEVDFKSDPGKTTWFMAIIVISSMVLVAVLFVVRIIRKKQKE